MFAPLVSFLIVAILIAGGGGTVFAAQGSQPGEALYELKLASEDARLSLANTNEEKVRLSLSYSNRRIEELKTLLESGALPPETLLARLQTQLDQSLGFAAGLEEPQLIPALNQARLEFQNQIQNLEETKLSAQISSQGETSLVQAREMVQERLKVVETGLVDPQTFREQWRHRQSEGPLQPTGQTGGYGPGPKSSQTPGSGAGPGPQATCTCTPGSGNGPGPLMTGTQNAENGSGFGQKPVISGTPTPGSGYGPGPGPAITGTPTPGSGYGPGPGPQITQSTGNEEPGQPATNTPDGNGGNGPGPGPEPGSTCTPQSGPGPDPTQAPGGNEGGGGGGSGNGPQPTPGMGSGGQGGNGNP